MALASAGQRQAGKSALTAWSVALAGVLCAAAVARLTYPRVVPLAVGAWVALLILFLLRFEVLRPQRLLTCAAAMIPLGVRIPLTESTSFDSALMVFQLGFLVALSQRLLTSGERRRMIALDIAVLWLMLATAAATVAAMDPVLAVRKAYYLLNWGMIYFLVRWTVTDIERLRWTCRGLVFGALVLALIGIAQFIAALLTSAVAVGMAMLVILPMFEGTIIQMNAQEAFTSLLMNWLTPFGLLRVMGTHVTPMSFAQGISQFVFLPLVVLYQWGASRWRQVWSVLCVGIMGIGILLSFSRGGWLAIGAGAVFYLVLNREMTFRAKAKVVGWLVVGGACAALLMALVLPDLFAGLERFVVSAVAEPETGDQWSRSNIIRIHTQADALRLLAADPILGVGPGNFGPAAERSVMASAHNLYLQAAAEMGMAGLIGYLAVIVLALQAAYRAARWGAPGVRIYAFAIFVGFLTVCIHSAFQSYNYTPKVAMGWWTMVGLCGALWSLGKRE